MSAGVVKFDSVSFSIWAIGSLLGHTWRINEQNDSSVDLFNDKGKGCIYCFWHSNLLTLAYFYRNTGKIAVVSGSNDGVRAAAVASHWNHRIIFGSSSRGGASALRQCARALSKKENMVITPDGPRGPKETVKPGVAQISIMSGAPVVCMKAVPQKYWRLKSWDGFFIPKPFTRLKIHLSSQIIPSSKDLSEGAVENFRGLIQERLVSLGSVAL